jgi:hypothetical protein
LWADCGHGIGRGPKPEFRRTVTPWASWLAINIRLANVLLPGDLAVWDGHIATIVGSGMVIAVVPLRHTHRGR